MTSACTELGMTCADHDLIRRPTPLFLNWRRASSAFVDLVVAVTKCPQVKVSPMPNLCVPDVVARQEHILSAHFWLRNSSVQYARKVSDAWRRKVMLDHIHNDDFRYIEVAFITSYCKILCDIEIRSFLCNPLDSRELGMPYYARHVDGVEFLIRE
jgi:hypothetical protein